MGKKQITCKEVKEYLMDENNAIKDYSQYKDKKVRGFAKDEQRHCRGFKKLNEPSQLDCNIDASNLCKKPK